jgi:hypothetical protein
MLKIFPVFICSADIQTQVFCEVTYAGHSVLWFVQLMDVGRMIKELKWIWQEVVVT